MEEKPALLIGPMLFDKGDVGIIQSKWSLEVHHKVHNDALGQIGL